MKQGHCRLGSDMNGAIELPRRQRQQRITAREEGVRKNV
jgi:hypothetical protein